MSNVPVCQTGLIRDEDHLALSAIPDVMHNIFKCEVSIVVTILLETQLQFLSRIPSSEWDVNY